MSAPDQTAPATRNVMSWGRRKRPHLAEDHARRQGEITRLAFLLLGRDTAIAFLNTAHAGLGGRPLDLATASDQGRNSVEAEIGRLAYAAPRDAAIADRRKHPRTTIDGDGREIPGDRRQRSREPAEAHFRHLNDARDPRAASPDAGSE